MGNTYTYASLPEAAENYVPGTPWQSGGGGAPIIDNHDSSGNVIHLKTNRWHVMEQRIVLNDIGQSNGYGALWLNGNKVYERTNILWRNEPESRS